MMQTKLLSVLFIASAAILLLGAMQSSAMAYPYSQQKQGGYSHHGKMMKPVYTHLEPLQVYKMMKMVILHG